MFSESFQALITVLKSRFAPPESIGATFAKDSHAYRARIWNAFKLWLQYVREVVGMISPRDWLDSPLVALGGELARYLDVARHEGEVSAKLLVEVENADAAEDGDPTARWNNQLSRAVVMIGGGRRAPGGKRSRSKRGGGRGGGNNKRSGSSGSTTGSTSGNGSRGQGTAKPRGKQQQA